LRVGVLVVAATWPLLIGAMGGTGRAEASCLAYFGSRSDVNCLNVSPGTVQSSGGAFSRPVPPVAVAPAPDGADISTGQLFPGQTIDQPPAP
jgi:hypothetical protein